MGGGFGELFGERFQIGEVMDKLKDAAAIKIMTFML